jgi:hypothetical protein
MKLLCYLFLFLNFPLFSQPSVIFRLDDYHLENRLTQDSIRKIFKKFQMPLSIGIIPFDDSGELFINYKEEELNALKSAIREGFLEPVMHGFAHLNNEKHQYKSEFAGEELDVQFQRLKKGKTFLEETLEAPVQVFSPPWNTYDKYTLTSLKKAGFTCISSDLAGKSYGKNLHYLPYTLEDFDNLIQIIENNKLKKGVIVVMFHTYSFSGGKFQLADLEKLLEELKAKEVPVHSFQSYISSQQNKPGRWRLYLNSRLNFNPILKKFHSENSWAIYLENSILIWVYFSVWLLGIIGIVFILKKMLI